MVVLYILSDPDQRFTTLIDLVRQAGLANTGICYNSNKDKVVVDKCIQEGYNQYNNVTIQDDLSRINYTI